MTFRLRGSLASLTTFQRGLNGLGKGLVAATPKIAKRAQSLLAQAHSAKRDPYGKKWRARKKSYPWPLMNKSGALLGGIIAKSVRRSINIQIAIGYGIFHQFGTSQMVARMLIPSKGRGLPPRWVGDFAKIVKLELASRLK